MQLAAVVLARNAIAALVAQAVVAEWTAGRLAIPWSDALAPAPSGLAVSRRFGFGAAWGLGAAGAVVAASCATHQASIAAGAPALGALLLGVASALLAAVRDELLLRGMVLKIGRSLLGPIGAVALCGFGAAAARLGAADATALAVGVAGLRGVALAFVWTRDRGAWMAVGATAAWTWALESATRGDVVDVRMGAGDPASSATALVVVAAMGACGAWWAWPRTQPARQA
jgi:hypothetical protein